MEATEKLYVLRFNEVKTYLFAILFVVGNLLLPQLCHLLPQGGMILLPIYFFTLIGAYRYGWRTGLLIAVLSPLANSILFGMPTMAVLPAILSKSVLLAVAASWTAHRFKVVSLRLLLMVVMAYQVTGTLIEWALIGDFYRAVQDFRIGIPGMLLQVVGGYLWLKKA